MLLKRQKQLLGLLSAHRGHLGNLDFQKLLLLYCREVEREPSYEFVPYRFGGFSFTSYADKRRLIQQGMLADLEKSWSLTPVGEKAAQAVPSPIKAQMTLFAKEHAGLRGDVLVAHAYRRHPYYAIRSEIAGRVLGKDKGALKAIAQSRPVASKAGLYTIGYEGHSVEAYLNALLTNGVTILCDVRRNPLSRKYGFSKSTLSKSCAGVGIGYEHMPELGIASELRQELHTQKDYDELFELYRRDSLPHQGLALRKLEDMIAAGERIALTCYEHLPKQCHRHCVAEALERRLGQGSEARHL